MKTCFCAILSLLISAAPAFAVTVNNPSNGATVNSPFTVSGSAATCSRQTVSAIGYSLDSGTPITVAQNQSMNVNVAASAGAHTVHVMVWGDQGAVCVKDVAITVTSDESTGPPVPSNAVSVSNLQTLSNWKGEHDSGTNGSANGQMSMVGSPSYSGTTRKFVTSYKNKGGERYSVTFGENTTATNFLYDAWVYVTSSASNIANLEMDLNQTMPNGQTVIFGFQCSAYSGTWEYSENLGTPTHAKGHWAPTKAACNVSKWSPNTWHHVQVSYSRTDSGMVTYQSVYFDGVESPVNATVLAARALGWGNNLSTNFQIDGRGSSGSSTIYLDDLIIYRW